MEQAQRFQVGRTTEARPLTAEADIERLSQATGMANPPLALQQRIRNGDLQRAVTEALET